MDLRAGLTAFVTDAFTREVPLKLVALALAIALFSIVHADQDAQRTLPVDVVALLPPAGSEKMLVGELPHQVSVTLRGSRSRINELSRDDIPPIQIDLSDTSQRYFYFEASDIEVSGNVQVVGVEPASVPLTWAVSAERKVAIRPRLRGDVPPGFSVKQPVLLSPPMVTIRGPESAVSAISEVHTEAILLDGLEPGRHEPRIPLERLPDRVVYVEDMAVQALISIEPEVAEQTFRRIEVLAVGGGEASLRPPHVSITLAGVKARLATLDPEQLVPTVELDPEQPAGSTAPREVKLQSVPEGVRVVRIAPPTVFVKPRK